ncbi:glycosidase [Deferribacter abyssi]|uniref:glycoside hydrolase family 130 protein n=1 Tax=Deferribacter abyssi TaxID=213806 RepID=UPI003C173F37
MGKFDIFKRYENNPIITRDHIPYRCNTVFNAAACEFNGKIVLLLRVEDVSGHSHLTLAYSDDGYNFKIEKKPWIMPSNEEPYAIYEKYGVEDPRITKIGDTYYITYVAFGPYGPRIGLGFTKDFTTFTRIGFSSETDNKDGVLFPEKINGKYYLIDRPGGMAGTGGSLWITESFDLIHWGNAKVLLSPEPGWGNYKLGASTPPIKTDEGWLLLYHGVRKTAGGNLYRVGAILLDLEKPWKVIRYTPHFIFAPRELYERIGDVPNVVFPCGWIVKNNKVLIYYGAADTYICVAETKLQMILENCTAIPRDCY